MEFNWNQIENNLALTFGYPLSSFKLCKIIESEIENVSAFMINQIQSILTSNQNKKIFTLLKQDIHSILCTSILKWGSFDIAIKCLLSYVNIIYKGCNFNNSLDKQFEDFIAIYEFKIIFTSLMVKLIKFETPSINSISTNNELISFSLKNYEVKQYWCWGSELFLTFDKSNIIQNYSLKFINSLDLYIIQNNIPEPSIEIINYTKSYFNVYPRKMISYLNTIAEGISKKYNFVFFSNIKGALYENKSSKIIDKIIERQKNGSIHYYSLWLNKKNDLYNDEIKEIYDNRIDSFQKENIIQEHYKNLENDNIPTHLKCCIQENNNKIKNIKKLDLKLCCGLIISNGLDIYSFYRKLVKATLSEEYVTLLK